MMKIIAFVAILTMFATMAFGGGALTILDSQTGNGYSPQEMAKIEAERAKQKEQPVSSNMFDDLIPKTTPASKSRVMARHIFGPADRDACLEKFLPRAKTNVSALLIGMTCSREFGEKVVTDSDLNYFDCLRDDLDGVSVDRAARLIRGKCRRQTKP